MVPTTPDREKFTLPEDTESVTYAEDQPQYQPLPVLRTPDGTLATWWLPDMSELALLNRGVPVCLIIKTFNQPLQPVSIGVGGADLTK